jgi:hypothetical protein
MEREMPYIVLVPVELGLIVHGIYCTLLVHTLRMVFLSIWI